MLAGRRRRALIVACASRVRADEAPEGIVQPARFPVADVELSGGFVTADTIFRTGFGDLVSAGGGFRVSLTLLPDGIVPHLEDRVFVANGLWFVHGLGCDLDPAAGGAAGRAFDVGASGSSTSRGCGADNVLMPISAAWSVALDGRLNLYVEPGAVAWARTPPKHCASREDCTNAGLFPSMELGVRYVLGEHGAIVARVGYPFVSIGLSAM
jgi:hypothetical protein